MAVRYKRIRQLVRQILKNNNILEPPVPVAALAHSYNLVIAHHRSTASNISGILATENGRSIIGINSSHSPERQRFTIAHELGHFLLHTRNTTNAVHIDKIFETKYRSPLSSMGMDNEEKEANIFAAELLMPYDFLAQELSSTPLDLEDDDTVKVLARRYGVSHQSMVIRLTSLGYLKA